MIEIKGDLLEILYRERFDACCCTTNTTLNSSGELIMGKGIAKIFQEKWPWLPSVWGYTIKKTKQRKFPLVLVHASNDEWYNFAYHVAFPTKTDWRKNSTLEIVENSAKQLEYLADSLGWERVLLPRPGCSNGGLNWEDVKPKIEFLDDRFYILSRPND